jgi:uncharacterized membrane protein
VQTELLLAVISFTWATLQLISQSSGPGWKTTSTYFVGRCGLSAAIPTAIILDKLAEIVLGTVSQCCQRLD